MPLCLTVFDPVAREVRAEEFEGEQIQGRARALPGCNAVHLHVYRPEEEAKCLRIEVSANVDFPVRFLILWDAGAQSFLVAHTDNRRYFTLPPEARPQPAIAPAREGKLDLIFLIDATAKILSEKSSAWKEHLDKLTAFAEALRAYYPDLRLGSVSFSDEPMGQLAHAADLTPSSLDVVKPGRIGAATQAQIRKQLEAVSYDPGGDYVDAVGDGLASCHRRIEWRSDARKILVLTGDSPGHSLLYPLPAPADARARRADVDAEAIQLHAQGVEIVTLFTDGDNRPLVAAAREQYQRIASVPAWAYTLQEFDGEEAANQMRSPQWGAIGREACYPILERTGEQAKATTATRADAASPADFERSTAQESP